MSEWEYVTIKIHGDVDAVADLHMLCHCGKHAKLKGEDFYCKKHGLIAYVKEVTRP